MTSSSTTKARQLGDLVRASKDARPPDQTGWGSEARPGAATEPAGHPEPVADPQEPAPSPESAETPMAETPVAGESARGKRGKAQPVAPDRAAPQVTRGADYLPPYLQLERVSTRVPPEVIAAIRTAEVRLKAARPPAARVGERLNTNTVIRAALRAVVESGALEDCSGASEDELVASIRRKMQSRSN